MRWEKLHKGRWTEYLRPRVERAEKECIEYGVTGSELEELAERLRELDADWGLVCAYRDVAPASSREGGKQKPALPVPTLTSDQASLALEPQSTQGQTERIPSSSKADAPSTDRTSATLVAQPFRKSGRPPEKKEVTIARMHAEINTDPHYLDTLRGMKGEELAKRYGLARTWASDIRRIVLSEFDGKTISDK